MTAIRWSRRTAGLSLLAIFGASSILVPESAVPEESLQVIVYPGYGRGDRFWVEGRVIRDQTLIINLPGQPKAIAETLEGAMNADGSVRVNGIFAAVPYCIDLIGGPYLETRDEIVKGWRPKNAQRPAR